MTPSRPAATAIDYFTVVLSPLLILGLVCSLVFFLVEILYASDGPWRFRLQWILFFYVAGVVLTARLAMNGETASRAPLYSLILAALTYLGLAAFIEYPEGVRPWSFLANLLLVAIVWWATQRLVWDCTHVDDQVEGAAQGLMDAAGFQGHATRVAVSESASAKPLGFLDRWRQYSEQLRSGRVLGVWVVYFSLAAIPLFGLGQALLPLSSPERRVWAFQLLAVYLGCGLGLLLTTCFLSLRRYLRQRQLQMPAKMTATWLGSGAVLIGGLLLGAALLPRPYSENALVSDWKAGSKQRQASAWSPQSDSPAEGKGSQGEAKDTKGDPGNKAGKAGEPGKDGKDGKDRDGTGGKGQSKDKDGKQSKEQDSGGKKQGNADAAKPPPPTALTPPPWFSNLAGWLKGIVFALLAITLAYFIIRHGLAFFANFSDWAKRWLAWWNGLVGGTTAAGSADDEPIEADADAPWAAFRDPFVSGAAERWPLRELVRYSFAALEAWAREHGVERAEGETAQEFVARLCDSFPAWQQQARSLLHLYTLAEYSAAEAPPDGERILRAFWRRISSLARSPVAG
jgi:uncharacterized protein YjiS (DUF1127 family)